jgi:3-hydroxyisobutyrate dehydrogenase-like beta-hydroxyacid dehydrogenase
MGAAVGGTLVSTGLVVAWASEARSTETCERADTAGLEDVSTLSALVGSVDVIVAVCPPHAARAVAEAVVAQGFAGTYVDANAIAPSTAHDLGTIIEGAGAGYVDGSLIGPPPRAPGTTRLFLSGHGAVETASLFDGTLLQTVVLSTSPVAASAVKMSYAAYTKGTQALLLAARGLAEATGVDAALVEEWARSQPGLAERHGNARDAAAAKGWRWESEMREIATAFAAADLPSGFHEAAAEVFRQFGNA